AGQPANAAGGDVAVRRADVQPDGDEGVVACEHVGEPELAPDLREAGVDVEEDARARGREELWVADEAHDVQEEPRLRRPREQLPARETRQGNSLRPEDGVRDSVRRE